ncbi:MAG: patatin-like phospholipase family protein [Myxococcota bacterium]
MHLIETESHCFVTDQYDLLAINVEASPSTAPPGSLRCRLRSLPLNFLTAIHRWAILGSYRQRVPKMPVLGLLSMLACAPHMTPVEISPPEEPAVLELEPIVEVQEPEPPKVIAPPRIALVLGGGGARGFAHIGVLRILEQEKIPIDLVVGTSVGSLIGALYAAEPNTFELEWKAFKLSEEDFFDFSILSAGMGPVKGDALKAFVAKNIKTPDIERFKLPFIAIATDLNTGERVEIKSGSVVDAVRASASIPGVFRPVTLRHRMLVDGGVVANLAVDTARAAGADIVIASNITEKVVDYEIDDLVTVVLQSINIMMGQMTQAQVAMADVVITPAVGDVGTMDFSHKKRCMQEGIAATQLQVAAIKQAIRNYYVERGGLPPGE